MLWTTIIIIVLLCCVAVFFALVYYHVTLHKRAQAFNAEGNRALDAGNLAEAVEKYSRAIDTAGTHDMDPADYVYYANRSGAYLRAGDWKNALKDAISAIDIEPGPSVGHLNKAAALYSLERHDDAIAAFEEGLKKCPDDAKLKDELEALLESRADAFNTEANEALRTGNLSEALEKYSRAIDMAPYEHEVYYYNRSGVYCKLGDGKNALKDAISAIDCNPESSIGYITKGEALYSLERFDDAISAYEDGLKKCPNDVDLKKGLDSVLRRKILWPSAVNGKSTPEPGKTNACDDDLIDRMKSDPKTRPYLDDEEFMSKIEKLQQNPTSLEQMLDDPRVAEVLGPDILCINVVDASDNSKERHTLLQYTPLDAFFKKYAAGRSFPVRRFELNGSALFLSSIGKQTPQSLGLKDGDEIKVVARDSTAQVEKVEEPTRPKRKTAKGKKKRHKKSNRKKSMLVLPPKNEEEELKKLHSKAISKVFEEAAPQLRDIRQRLAALNLERTKPKQRKSQPKVKPVAKPVVRNPQSVGIGGKAGKSHFVVHVGEAANLYTTRAKPAAVTRELDLHGCTKKEALAKLDECLSEWVDTAMKGEYPWVITAKIVCGGGSQTLSEVVEGWIRKNANVSNAPKNLHSFC